MNTQWNAEVVTPVEEGAGTKVLDNQSNVQPTLEAGSNITIANGEISATGGGAEYTAGSGIDITDNTISVDSDIRSGAAAGATAVQAADLATVATSGSYNDLSNKPSIPAAQVNSDWNAASGVAQILNKPTLATVATSGSYADLSNKPTIPTVAQSYNALSTDAMSGTAVAEAISGTGQVPSVTSTDNGKVLKATYEGGVGSFGWDAAPSGVPSTTSADNGKVLGVTDTSGTLGWVAQTPAQVNADWDAASGAAQILNKPTIPTVDQTYSAVSTNAQSGVAVAQAIASVPTTSYTAGDGIDIDANDEISAKLGNGLSIGTSSASFNEQTVANTDNNYAYYLCKLDNKLISAIEGAGLTYTNTEVFYIGAGKYYPVIAQFQTGDHPNKPDMNYYIKLEWSSQSCTSQNVPANTSFTVTTSKLNGGTITLDTVKQNPSNYCIAYFSSTISRIGQKYYGTSAHETETTGSVSGVGLVSGFITVDKPVPATQSSDNGKVLGVTDTSGTLGWVAQSTVTVDQVYSASSANAQSGVAVASAISGKQDTISDLSTIRSGAEAGATAVQPSDLATVATTGAYADLSGTPSLATVATSGSYADLSNKPTIPTVDQSYSASSTNAQSGVAVANAISAVKQVPSSTSVDEGKVLTVNSSGNAVWDAAPETVTIGYKEI